MSPRVSRPSQPIASQIRAGSGSVTIMEEFIGSQVRFWPLRLAVNPSVQRSTYGARTVPYGVTACFGLISVTGVASWMVTPSASTASASPLTSLTGCSRAPCGVQVEPTAPVTWTRSAVSRAPRRTRSVSPKAISALWNSLSRASWAGVCATSRTPPWWTSASMPSAAAARTTSPTVSFIAFWSRTAASWPCSLAYRSRPAMPLYSQPPLRPEAP